MRTRGHGKEAGRRRRQRKWRHGRCRQHAGDGRRRLAETLAYGRAPYCRFGAAQWERGCVRGCPIQRPRDESWLAGGLREAGSLFCGSTIWHQFEILKEFIQMTYLI
ncbi:hypothetical protein scyTo_0014000 [Scyliorhinus torazame]|uniref:Uncharacterized protein n=1 Tax=Scyliorhinus torazame TaxID=75743 RepID=A0A401NFK9_SCYTO|nr:hypothetical protein [Scyliorhinus torazame]